MDRVRHTLSVLTDRPVKAGRPIYLDYMPLPSYFYLLRHGFVPISNIHDCLLVSLPPTSPSQLREQVLRSLGFPGADAVCLDVTRFLNDRALAFFLLRNASDAQLRRCWDFFEKTVRPRGDWESVEVRRCALDNWSEDSKRHWDAVAPLLRRELCEHLETLRGRFSTSIARDQLELRATEISEARRLALQWRVGRKHLLDLVIGHLRETPLKTEETPQLQEVGDGEVWDVAAPGAERLGEAAQRDGGCQREQHAVGRLRTGGEEGCDGGRGGSATGGGSDSRIHSDVVCGIPTGIGTRECAVRKTIHVVPETRDVWRASDGDGVAV